MPLSVRVCGSQLPHSPHANQRAECPMTEYQKMISSQVYNCMAPELDVLRRETARRHVCAQLDGHEHDDEQERVLQQTSAPTSLFACLT